MLQAVLCGTATADSPIRLPGSSNVCVSVMCAGATTVSVEYTIDPGSVTFHNGTTHRGPFNVNCPNGTSLICRTLSFIGGPAATFTVRIRITDTAGPVSGICPVTIAVTT